MKLCYFAKSPKGKDCLFLSKEGDFYWLEDSPLTLKPLLLVARFEKSSKSDAWLQSKRCSLMAKSLLPLTLAKSPKDFLK